jgi:hypothetical protein
MNTAEALLFSLRASEVAGTVLVDGEPAAMFGAAPVVGSEKTAIVWLLCSDLIERVPMQFCRACRTELGILHRRWPVLLNAIDARYARSLRWAEWLRGVLGPPVPFGAALMPFRWVRFEASPGESHEREVAYG